MTDANSNIVILRDYARAREVLTNDDVHSLLLDQRAALRRLDTEVSDLLSTPHKLKNAQFLKDEAILIERNLTDIYDWLEDKIADTTNGDEQKSSQSLLKQCEQLISRNERIKKNLTDDMAACRYVEAKEALDPVKIAGFLTGIPIAAVTLTKTLLSDKPGALVDAAGAGAALGVFLAFHRQTKKAWDHAAMSVSKSPRQIREQFGKSFAVYYLKTNARNSVIATAWTFSVYAKKTGDIKPQQPASNARPVIAVSKYER